MNTDRFRFRYIFSDGNKTFTRYFTLDEIQNGEPFEVLENEPLLKNYKNIDIVQCIGDWDKNNKLIYEGDLLRYKDETQEYLFEVAFDQEDLQFKFFFRGNNYYTYEFELSDCEVIGNIYESKTKDL